MEKRKTLNIGSLSEGTLRTEDIWDSLIYELRQLAPRKAAQLEREWDAIPEDDPDGLRDMLLNESLYPELEAFVPAFCYLGSNEGDGASIGVWPSYESLDQAKAEGEVWQDPDDGSRMPKSASYRMVVSDHGNVTLYHANGREIWGVV